MVISNHSSFRVLLDKIASVYFSSKMYLYFSNGTGQPREPAVCQLYRHFPSLSSMSSLVSSRDIGKSLSQKKKVSTPSLILSTRRSSGYTMPVYVLSKLIHIATPDKKKMSSLCRVRFGGVNWIPATTQDCRRQKI